MTDSMIVHRKFNELVLRDSNHPNGFSSSAPHHTKEAAHKGLKGLIHLFAPFWDMQVRLRFLSLALSMRRSSTKWSWRAKASKRAPFVRYGSSNPAAWHWPWPMAHLQVLELHGVQKWEMCLLKGSQHGQSELTSWLNATFPQHWLSQLGGFNT